MPVHRKHRQYHRKTDWCSIHTCEGGGSELEGGRSLSSRAMVCRAEVCCHLLSLLACSPSGIEVRWAADCIGLLIPRCMVSLLLSVLLLRLLGVEEGVGSGWWGSSRWARDWARSDRREVGSLGIPLLSLTCRMTSSYDWLYIALHVLWFLI